MLTVLFILVLLTTLSVYMVEDEHLSIRRISNHRDAEQGHQMTTGAEQWAAKILERDAKENSIDHLNEPWNSLLPEVSVEEGALRAEIQDLQGLFNINNLAPGKDKKWYPLFVRLLRALSIDEGLADAVVDWLDENQDVSGVNGAEDPEYLSLDPPYRAANRLITDVGELLLVKGFNETIVSRISDYTTALPESNTKINVNTSPALLLRVLTRDILPEATVESLLTGRGDKGFQDVETFITRTEFAAQSDQVEPLVTVSSRYFQVRSEAKFGRLTSVLLSVIQRSADGEQATVVRRRRGLS